MRKNVFICFRKLIFYFLLIAVSFGIQICFADQFTNMIQQSNQLILVTSKDWHAIEGQLHFFKRDTNLHWQRVGQPFLIVLGKNGLGWDRQLKEKYRLKGPIKTEGDNKSPAGLFPINAAFGFTLRITNKLPYFYLTQNTVCIDDPNSKFYNYIITPNANIKQDWNSGEQMREIELYKLGLVVGYNQINIDKHAGSCIFMHICRNNHHGTAGCTAMSETNIRYLINHLDAKGHPILVQLPETQYLKLKQQWNLP